MTDVNNALFHQTFLRILHDFKQNFKFTRTCIRHHALVFRRNLLKITMITFYESVLINVKISWALGCLTRFSRHKTLSRPIRNSYGTVLSSLSSHMVASLQSG